MKRLILFILTCFSAQAATVQIAFTNYDMTMMTGTVQVFPVGPVNAYGAWLVTGLPKRMSTTNGIITTNLLLGNYELRIPALGVSNLIFAVPNDVSTNVYTVTTPDNGGILISGANNYNYTPGVQQVTSADSTITFTPISGKGKVDFSAGVNTNNILAALRSAASLIISSNQNGAVYIAAGNLSASNNVAVGGNLNVASWGVNGLVGTDAGHNGVPVAIGSNLSLALGILNGVINQYYTGTNADVKVGGANISGNLFIGNNNSTGDFLGNGSSLNNLSVTPQPWSVKFPLLYAPYNSGATAYPASLALAGSFVGAVYGDTSMQFGNDVPSAPGYFYSVVNINMGAQGPGGSPNYTTGAHIYVNDIAKSGESNWFTLKDFSQAFDGVTTNFHTYSITNCWFEDYANHEILIGTFLNAGFGSMTNRLWINGITITAYEGPAAQPPGCTDGPMVPPMGWEEWSQYSGQYNESTVTNAALKLISTGMQAAGYTNVIVDTGVHTNRDVSGNWIVASNAWPHGMAYVGTFLHNNGFSFGGYESRVTGADGGGSGTQVGSVGFETNDAAFWAGFGCDSLKYDGFSNHPADAADGKSMKAALQTCGRKIWLNIVAPFFAAWKVPIASYWDVSANWAAANAWTNALANLDLANLSASWSGPGHFNQPDMVPSFSAQAGPITLTESEALFGMWCMVPAPLILGVDMTNITATQVGVFTNMDLVAIDQDTLCEGAFKRMTNWNGTGAIEMWSRALSDGSRAVALFNRSGVTTNISVYWTNIFLEPSAATVYSCWGHTNVTGTFTTGFTNSVASHFADIYRITGTPMAPALYLSDIAGPIPRGTGYAALKDHALIPAANLQGNFNAMIAGGSQFNAPFTRKGLFIVAPSSITYDLTKLPGGGVPERFVCDAIGVDAETAGLGSVRMLVYGDGVLLFDSGTMIATTPWKSVNVDITGRSQLNLRVIDSAGTISTDDRADWGGARILRWLPRSARFTSP